MPREGYVARRRSEEDRGAGEVEKRLGGEREAERLGRFGSGDDEEHCSGVICVAAPAGPFGMSAEAAPRR